MTPARDPVSGAFGLFFPRPAFEIWLPLPTLLAAIPMVLLGTTSYAAALAVPVLLGALIPVLAWRIGADLAAERGLPLERARTLALGSGLVSAVALPLVLPSALLDFDGPIRGRGARGLPARDAPHPRAARGPDPRSPAGRPRPGAGAGRAVPQRGDLDRARLGGAGAGGRDRTGHDPRESRAARPARAGRRPSWRSSSSPRGWSARPWSSGARCPGRPSRTRGRSAASRSSPGRIPRRWPATWRPARVSGWAIASPGSRTTCSTCSPCPACRSRSSDLPGWRGSSAAARSGMLLVSAVATFAITTLRLPGPDHLGHVPPRGGAGTCPADRQRARRARRRSRMGGPATRVDASGRVAGPALRRRRGAPLPGARDSVVRQATRPAPRRATRR